MGAGCIIFCSVPLKVKEIAVKVKYARNLLGDNTISTF